MSKARKPRTVEGYKTRISEVETELEKVQTLLAGLTEVDDDYDPTIEKVTDLEIQLAILKDGLAELENSGSSFDSSDEDVQQDEPEKAAQPKEKVTEDSLLGKSALVRCANEYNVMVNPFNPNVKIVGHSITEITVDAWTEAQIKAGILVARL